MSLQRIPSLLGLLLILVGCRPATEAHAEESGVSTVAMLFAPDGPLEGGPNLYELNFAMEGRETLTRSGSLPESTDVMTINGLPEASLVSITGGLFRDNVVPSAKTHACEAAESVALVAGEVQSVAMTCMAVDNIGAGERVSVFMKVAAVSLTVNEMASSDFLAGRDWSAPVQFAHFDDLSRKITLQINDGGTYVHVGGELSYYAPSSAETPSLLHAMIFDQAALEVQPVSGKLLSVFPGAATMRVNGAPSFFEEGGKIKMLLPLLLENEAGSLKVEGNLIEEAAFSEFTVVSYNVENLFDQVDEDRNSGYGDYRIFPNDRGYSSNWGELQDVNGEMLSFTDIKASNVVRALEAIDASGPAIVGLQEIESKAALERVFAKAQHLGYVAAQFSEWPENEVPNAIGLGVMSKFPIKAWNLISVTHPAEGAQQGELEPIRRILKVVIDVMGHDLVVYNNHWKSKSGPESWRLASATALQADIEAESVRNPKFDYVIMGDLNSNYNENVVLENRHNDTDGKTGINTVLRAAGNELNTLLDRDHSKYNLHYEREFSQRRTAWHGAHGWSAMDNMIIGPGMYDGSGISYVDNSFEPARKGLPRLSFLFHSDGTTHRWEQIRQGPSTQHVIGGYSDHAPIFARFEVRRLQSEGTIWINEPSVPDAGDLPLPAE